MSDDFFSEAPPEPATPSDGDRWPNLRLLALAAVVGWLAVISLYCVVAHWW